MAVVPKKKSKPPKGNCVVLVVFALIVPLLYAML